MAREQEVSERSSTRWRGYMTFAWLLVGDGRPSIVTSARNQARSLQQFCPAKCNFVLERGQIFGPAKRAHC